MVFMVMPHAIELAALWCDILHFPHIRRVSTACRALAATAKVVLDQSVRFLQEEDGLPRSLDSQSAGQS